MAATKPALASASETRPSGRFGPASEGTTVEMSSSIVSVKTGSGEDLVRNRPWCRQYFSTSATRAAFRPVSVR